MIHLITGRQGSGKTLFLVKKAYEGYNKGKTIYSNVKLKFPYKQLEYKDIVKCKLENAVVIIDEIHLLLSSRLSMSKVNREICNSFISMVRKKNLEVYGSTQFERKVDIRFRDESDYFYVCKKYCFLNGEFTEVYHNEDLPLTVPVFIKMDIQEMFSGNWINSSFHANPYFKLFNTREIIRIKGVGLL